VPIIAMEQLPDKMGPTIPELRELLAGVTEPIAKATFSCSASPEFREALAASGRRQVLLAGIETHVCVYQTAMELADDYEVQLVTDAVSSRTAQNKAAALTRLQQAAQGSSPRYIAMTTVEMAVFEMLHTAEHPAFRDILRIIK
jgi:nicotinamidase-related amidase